MVENDNAAERQRIESEEPRYNLLGHPEEIQLLLMKHIAEKDLKNLLMIPRMKKMFEQYEGEFPPPSGLARTLIRFVCNDQSFSIEIINDEGDITVANPSFQALKRYLKTALICHFLLTNRVPSYFQVDHSDYRKLKHFMKSNHTLGCVTVTAVGVANVPFDVASLFPNNVFLRLNLDGQDLQLLPPAPLDVKVHVLDIKNTTPTAVGQMLLTRNKTIPSLTFESDKPLSLNKLIQEWKQGQHDISDIKITFSAHVRLQLVNATYIRKNTSGFDEKLRLKITNKDNKKICTLKSFRCKSR